MSRFAAALLCSTALHAGLRVEATLSARAGAWTDDFSSFNSALWTQQTDIEHCNDGACFLASPDHLAYGPAGLSIALNQSPCNQTRGGAGCCDATGKCARWAAGHLASASAYLYGTYSVTAQPAHAAGGRTPPANAFSCWTPTYVGKPAHNEIAVCFSGSDSTDVHFSYWYDATAHTTHHTMPWEFSAAPHNYTVVWAPTRLTFLVDGAVVQTVDGTTSTIPSAAGHELLILRPKTDAFIADSAFAVAFASYDPAY